MLTLQRPGPATSNATTNDNDRDETNQQHESDLPFYTMSSFTFNEHDIPLYPAAPGLMSTVLLFSFRLCSALLLTLMAFVTYLYIKLGSKKKVRPFEEIPTLPDVHWLLGHAPFLYTHEPSAHHSIFAAHSSPSGITGIWGSFNRRAFTVLRADHARAVLRQSSSRDPMKLITRHGAKTLGEDSLILIPGGMRWKQHRSVVAKMFTKDAIRAGKRSVADCSQTVVRWLLQATATEGINTKGCPGHDGAGSVSLEAEHLFKLYSLEVFGKVSMGYDFNCFLQSNNITQEQHTLHQLPENGKICNCLNMSTMANSFAFLQMDLNERARPQNIFKPALQLYSIPTKYNREYWYHSGVVNSVMEKIISEELEKILSIDNFEAKNGGEKCKGRAKTEDNLVTHLLRFSLEDLKSSCGQKPKPASDSVRCPLAGSLETSSDSSNCPFSPSSTMTPVEKQGCIYKVMGILRTLLMAGYETTAVSLSFVVYFLSLHPRCQELCAQEADRVLGPSNGDDVFYNVDSNPDDLVYCRAVLTETIRLHLPVIFTSRVLEKDMSLDTGIGDKYVMLPKRTKVIISPSAIHRDERNFEQAQDFIPERWARWEGSRWVDRNYEQEKISAAASSVDRTASNGVHSTPESISAANPQNFFAFSDGARNCVGKRLAVLESSIMIAMLFRDMKVDLAEEDFELKTRRKFATSGPVSLPVVFRRRYGKKT